MARGPPVGEVDIGEAGVVLERSQNPNIDGIGPTNRGFVLW